MHGICCSVVDYYWLVLSCESPEGLEVDVMFLHCVLPGGRLSGCGSGGLG